MEGYKIEIDEMLDRAIRFAVSVRKATEAGVDDVVWILEGDDLIDALCIGRQFEWFFKQWGERADHARRVGKLGGRPKKLKKSRKKSIKRSR